MTATNRVNLTFIAVVHLLAGWTAIELFCGNISRGSIVLAAAWYCVCGLSITAGYHRLYAHRAYNATPILRVLFLIGGAASFQGSVISWAREHRFHHAHTDRLGDPHNVKQGLFWAHMGWISARDTKPTDGVEDIVLDPLARWHNEHLVLIGITFGMAAPAAIGTMWHDPLGALFMCGFLRLALQWHATWSINSIAHSVGRKPYYEESSARDSFPLSLITFGEGYHNYHHRFPRDYRNGSRLYHYDPTKWFIVLSAQCGLASRLRRVPLVRVRATVRARRR